MQIKEPLNYAWRNRGFVVLILILLFMESLMSIVVYRQWFINTYWSDKPAVAREMNGDSNEFEEKVTYKPEDVKMIPIMTRNFSADMDKDIVKIMSKKCDTIEMKLIVKTVDPLLLERTDVSFEVENTDPEHKGCSLTIITTDKVK